MYIDSSDPYDGGGASPSSGTTDPVDPPQWTPGGHGWWEFVNGAWRWITDPAPRAIRI